MLFFLSIFFIFSTLFFLSNFSTLRFLSILSIFSTLFRLFISSIFSTLFRLSTFSIFSTLCLLLLAFCFKVLNQESRLGSILGSLSSFFARLASLARMLDLSSRRSGDCSGDNSGLFESFSCCCCCCCCCCCGCFCCPSFFNLSSLVFLLPKTSQL